LCKLGAGGYPAEGPVQAVAYSPDGSSFAVGGLGGEITIRDSATGAVRHSAKHDHHVLSLAYSPNGQFLAAGLSDGKIEIRDISDESLRQQNVDVIELPGHTDGVLTVRFSPDGEQLLSGSFDNSARLWDWRDPQFLRGLR